MNKDNQWWQAPILYLIIIIIILSDSIESRTLINTVSEQNQLANQEQDSHILLPIHLTNALKAPFHSTDDGSDRNKQGNVLFNCEIDGYFPDPEDRSKYHICNSNIDTVVSCPDGAIWDTVKKSCFYINMVACGKDAYQVYEAKNTDTDITTRFMFKTSRITNSPIIVNSNVTTQYHTHSIFSNKKNHYDQSSSVKAHTTNEDKNMNTTSDDDQMNILDSSFKCPPGVEGDIPDPYDCSVYHYCTEYIHSPLQCVNGLFYSPKSGYCEWPEKAECKPICPPDGRRMRMPSTKSSQHYSDCINGQRKEQMCPEGQYYSTTSKECELIRK